MAEIGLVLHQHREPVHELARLATAWLRERGHGVRVAEVENGDDADIGRAGEFGAGLDLVLSLGGDGTMLRAVRLVAVHDVDVLGVNAGMLGYLTAIEPQAMLQALERYFAGDFQVEHRMLLAVEVRAAELPGGLAEHALNEAVLEKTAAGHTVHLSVNIDGERFTTYSADGLIAATPTGSTAYAFSARGPIVDPVQRAMLLTPVSPHMLFDRTLVLGPDSVVQITVTDHRPATLTVDGRHIAVLGDGDSILCRASGHTARMVSFGERRFHQVLKAKFGLNDR